MNEPSTSRGSGCGRGRNRRCSCGRGRMWGQQAQGADEEQYRWRELPQVWFLSRQTRQNTSFVATKVCLSRFFYFKLYKHMLYLSPNNSFVATNIILSRQKFCRNKHIFVATKDLFCRDKAFVATKIVLAAVPANDRTGSLCGNMYH